MIKVGEMKVNSNIKPRTYLIMIVLSIIMLGVTLRYSVLDYVKTKDYIKESAIITDEYAEYYETANNESSSDNYVEFDYEYRNKTYHGKQRVAFLFDKKIGNSITIYINPNNPDERKDIYNARAMYMADILISAWLIFAIKAYRIRKNLQEN